MVMKVKVETQVEGDGQLYKFIENREAVFRAHLSLCVLHFGLRPMNSAS